jgi:hypothetical protein
MICISLLISQYLISDHICRDPGDRKTRMIISTCPSANSWYQMPG